ncbi:putative sulfate transporter YchM [Pseudescherichia vulneris]|nr:putative sulfate transporter YchM [Pseudescherichia vulneris]
MALVKLAGVDVATIGSRFHYLLADGTQGSGIPQLLPQLVLPWQMPGSSFTLNWPRCRRCCPPLFPWRCLGQLSRCFARWCSTA